ncbi:MAG: Fic family protein [Pseudomonadota bacterium]
MSFSVISPPPDQPAALWRAEKIHAGLVTDTVNLEGNPFTLPEVQTLLDGVTVGGHRLSDAEQVQNQSASWKMLLDLVRNQRFHLNKATACHLNGIVARNEALEWGCFRDRPVSIAGTEWIPPDAATLNDHFEQLLQTLHAISDPYIRAMTLFLDMSRNQYFFDGNKRTGRLVMNGILLHAGYDVINIPYQYQQAFNTHMLHFYHTGEQENMFAFLLSCSTHPQKKPTLYSTSVSDPSSSTS